MHEEHLVNAETQHERSDVNVRALVIFAIIFVVFAVITHIVIWFFFNGLIKHEKRIAGPPLTSIVRPADASVPKNQSLLQPFPRKSTAGVTDAPNQDTPVRDLASMRNAEQRALTTYGWVDQQRGVVRVPIDVAKRMVVQRGLPVQARPAGGAQ